MKQDRQQRVRDAVKGFHLGTVSVSQASLGRGYGTMVVSTGVIHLYLTSSDGPNVQTSPTGSVRQVGSPPVSLRRTYTVRRITEQAGSH